MAVRSYEGGRFAEGEEGGEGGKRSTDRRCVVLLFPPQAACGRPPIPPSPPYDEYDISLTNMNASSRGVQTRFSTRP